MQDDGTSSDDVSSQKPLETWSDSEVSECLSVLFTIISLKYCIQENGHKGDIMSVAFGSPDLMATAGSNGEVSPLISKHSYKVILHFVIQIIVWRLILCNVICKLKPPIKGELN